ncbi:DNA cytosine methyltransferase [Polynucleobacter asymbioticus]|nr:DNA cytosine methyltransferase [Polynucleobacter asymbioticus]
MRQLIALGARLGLRLKAGKGTGQTFGMNKSLADIHTKHNDDALKVKCKTMNKLTSIEICAGAGGQALGLELAGFEHEAAIEIDKNACATLRLNRPNWNVIEADLKEISVKNFKGIDLFAGGVPCPPFSIAGKQLGENDERDLFPDALRMISECNPKAVLLENVRGLSSPKFNDYRMRIIQRLGEMGYEVGWKVLNASDYGVPQLRPRFILVALKKRYAKNFFWPGKLESQITVSDAISDLMFADGWRGGKRWVELANRIAPTIVGGSKKHGGADLGPGRAKEKWREMGVDGRGIADAPPGADLSPLHMPRLTLHMAARIQGFPDFWKFAGKKTATYRQIGNAFPPPVASAIGTSIQNAIHGIKISTDQNEQSELFTLI